MELIPNDLGSLLCRPRSVISRYCSVTLGPCASAVWRARGVAVAGRSSGEDE